MAQRLRWGDIRMIEFGGRQRSRPALILTRDAVIEVLTAITVAPITRTIRGIATEVSLDVANGLKQPSVATMDNIQTVRKETIGKWLGSFERSRARELREAILFAYGLEHV